MVKTISGHFGFEIVCVGKHKEKHFFLTLAERSENKRLFLVQRGNENMENDEIDADAEQKTYFRIFLFMTKFMYESITVCFRSYVCACVHCTLCYALG